MQRVHLPIFGPIPERDRVGLDRDASLTFEVHSIKDLFAELSGCDGACSFKEPVSEGRFPVVDVRDNRKVPDASLQIPALSNKIGLL
jgi:hypothetical protein